MAVTIIFETHATSVDNESHHASGHYDVALSELGIKQAREFRGRYKDDDLAAIFCSDLQRSYRTAEIAFEGRDIPIIKDARLRECDYGELTRHSEAEVGPEKPRRIDEPFPGGESYNDTVGRIRAFLEDLKRDYDGKKVLVIGHAATRYGIEHLTTGTSLLEVINRPWAWQ